MEDIDLCFKEIVTLNRKRNRRVTWEWIGEGWSGDYNEDDINDLPLLRFSCDRKIDGQWEQMEDASYCTRMPISTPIQTLARAAAIILEAIEDVCYKKRLEELSWLEPLDFNTFPQK